MVVELALRRRWEVQRQLRMWLPKILQGLPALLAVARLDCVQLRKRRSVVPSSGLTSTCRLSDAANASIELDAAAAAVVVLTKAFRASSSR